MHLWVSDNCKHQLASCVSTDFESNACRLRNVAQMQRNDCEGFMSLASNNARTAKVKGTRPSERSVSPFEDNERLMTLLEVSQLLGVPVATLYRWRYRGEGSDGLPDWTSCSISAGGCGGLDRDAGRSAACLVVRFDK